MLIWEICSSVSQSTAAAVLSVLGADLLLFGLLCCTQNARCVSVLFGGLVQGSLMKDSNQQMEDKKVTERLVELIYGASSAQQQALLSVLEKGWEHTVRRKHSRKKCFIAVDCAHGKRIFKDYIKNISLGGVFVEGHNAFTTGQTMTMAFGSPNNKSKPIKTTGRVAWACSLGIGVQFMQADKDVQRLFDSLPG